MFPNGLRHKSLSPQKAQIPGQYIFVCGCASQVQLPDGNTVIINFIAEKLQIIKQSHIHFFYNEKNK